MTYETLIEGLESLIKVLVSYQVHLPNENQSLYCFSKASLAQPKASCGLPELIPRHLSP